MCIIAQMNTIKKELLKELEKTKGIITEAIKKVKISRGTFYNYLRDDTEFKERVHEITEAQIDWVESKFLQKIEKLDTAALIFYLKTKARDRGYQERIETKDVTNEYKNMSQEERQREFKEAQEAIEKIRLKKVG